MKNQLCYIYNILIWESKMLELNSICKVYELGKKNDKEYQRVDALKNVSIKFRESEFVSILGPSGCGKTTLLNIVGGLDKYTSGDLIINGKSTKLFTDKEWDTYRNHSIGFVFQSYNLIPHQTVLQNVELALTLSGTNRADRRSRAIDALKRVGLEDKINAKPNQLSGGQMQRVAIARALVNNPDVILADEPTGALDSKTSVQIMDLLKEISKEKLVIMVTHNPELAENYSTRIIKLKDGELTEDSNPVKEDEVFVNRENKTTHKSMSFGSALMLSFKNLLTKKARTILVAFAGSIGIIGIALILALSTGFQAYINKTQEDTLSSYPITINQYNTDMFSMMMSLFTATTASTHAEDGVYASDTMSGLFEEATSQMANMNDLESFSKYLEEHKGELDGYVSDIKYTYDFDFYVRNPSGTSVEPESTALYDMILMYACAYLKHDFAVEFVNNNNGTFILNVTDNTKPEGYGFLQNYLPADNFNELITTKTTTITEAKFVEIIKKAMKIDLSTYSKMSFGLFKEMIDNPELLKSQYDLMGTNSTWADEANEVMLVLGENCELDDYTLYALGLISDEQMRTHMNSLFTENKQQLKLEYNDVIGKEYKILLENDYWYNNGSEWVCIKDSKGVIIDKTKYDEIIADPTKGKTVKISGVVKLKEDASAGQLSEGVAYTKNLTQELIAYHNNSDVVKSEQSGTPSAIRLTPTSISFYASSFEAKEVIEEFINKYNNGVEEEKKIEYTDYIGLIMSSVSTIINAISYILIGFVSVSLVVSSIMIGIITYISVLERIKEIGILRAVGASKKDIKRVFTAEAFIIGLVAGVLGIAVSLLMTIPINLIIKSLAGISGVAKLPVVSALILIGISMLLTIIAGLIPAKIASKKDPVIALRSE